MCPRNVASSTCVAATTAAYGHRTRDGVPPGPGPVGVPILSDWRGGTALDPLRIRRADAHEPGRQDLARECRGDLLGALLQRWRRPRVPRRHRRRPAPRPGSAPSWRQRAHVDALLAPPQRVMVLAGASGPSSRAPPASSARIARAARRPDRPRGRATAQRRGEPQAHAIVEQQRRRRGFGRARVAAQLGELPVESRQLAEIRQRARCPGNPAMKSGKPGAVLIELRRAWAARARELDRHAIEEGFADQLVRRPGTPGAAHSRARPARCCDGRAIRPRRRARPRTATPAAPASGVASRRAAPRPCAPGAIRATSFVQTARAYDCCAYGCVAPHRAAAARAPASACSTLNSGRRVSHSISVGRGPKCASACSYSAHTAAHT